MNINHWAIITAIIIFTGLVYLIDKLGLLPYDIEDTPLRNLSKGIPFLIYLSRVWFPLFFIFTLIFTVFISLSINVGISNEPTVYDREFEVGVYYDATIRPWRIKLFSLMTPKRGQLATLHWPIYSAHLLTKRIIGLPGDRVSYINKVIYINDKEVKQIKLRTLQKPEGNFDVYEEHIGQITHLLLRKPDVQPTNFYQLQVPEGKYFVLGDNRDFSYDSRDWGFVDRRDLIKPAGLVIWSYDSANKSFRWQRFLSISH